MTITSSKFSPVSHRSRRPLILLRLNFLLCFLCTNVEAQYDGVQSSRRPTNLDFETGKAGKHPPGWVITKASEDAVVQAELSRDRPYHGKQFVRVSQQKAASSDFGSLVQTVDAAPYHGKRVRFSAEVRRISPIERGSVQLWMRVDERRGGIGFFDDMSDRPISSPDWNEYTIIGDIDNDAVTITFGLKLTQAVEADMDSVSLNAIPGVHVKNELSRPLSERGLGNLVAFAKIFGYVRHFHPSNEALVADWYQLAVNGIRKAEIARTSEELCDVLKRIFLPVASTLRIFQTGQEPAAGPVVSNLLPRRKWSHLGFGNNFPPYVSEVVTEHAHSISETSKKPYIAEVGNGISISLPLVVFSERQTTPARPRLPPSSVRDRATRLAAIVISWNIFQHFYPYFDVVGTDWTKALTTGLRRAADDRDETTFLETLSLLVAELHDAHGHIFYPLSTRPYRVPISWDWVDGQLTVTKKDDAATPLDPGDIIIEIDGRPASDVFEDRKTLISSATPQWSRYAALVNIARGSKDSVLRLRKQSGEEISLRRSVSSSAPYLTEDRPSAISKLRHDLFYVDVTRATDQEINAQSNELSNADLLIVDARGAGFKAFDFIYHLADKPCESPWFDVPIVSRPDRDQLTFKTSKWTLQPKAPKFGNKLAVLINNSMASSAETFAAFVEHCKWGPLIGETTAGTDGNVNYFSVPGGYRIRWTGMRTLKQDGSKLHGIGISPTIRVDRTIKGIHDGRDEVLEKALNVLTDSHAQPRW